MVAAGAVGSASHRLLHSPRIRMRRATAPSSPPPLTAVLYTACRAMQRAVQCRSTCFAAGAALQPAQVSSAPLPPHNFSRAAVRDVDVWPHSLRLRRRHVAAGAAGALLPRRAPAAAAAPCMSLCTLPCPAPSRSIKTFTARLHRTVARRGGKEEESRCTAPATIENMDDEKYERK
jgi:hypothetical protein